MSTDAAPCRTTPEHARSLRRAFAPVLVFVALLWLLKLVETVSGLSFVHLGVFPRRLDGLDGVLWAPLIHGSWLHLIANTTPLLVLATALRYGYPRSARIVLPVIYAGTGLAVWLFARPSFHIGASGLSFGMLLFVFTIGVLRWEPRAIALAMVVSFLYGSMIWGIFPHDPAVSFESHLSGALIGVVLAFALRWRDPAQPRRRYDWEDREQDDHRDGEAIVESADPPENRSHCAGLDDSPADEHATWVKPER